MPVDPRQLSALLAIHKHGSFSRAAEAINLSQPALSASVASLEGRLGVKLVERTPRGSVLNELGLSLARHAENISIILEEVENEARQYKAGGSGVLRLGGTPISLLEIGVPAVARMTRSSRLRIDFTESSDDVLMAMLQSAEIDLLLGTVGVDQEAEDISEIPLLRISFDAIAPRGHPLLERRGLTLGDLTEWGGHWALPSKGSAFRRQIESFFIASGCVFPTHYFGCHTLSLQKELVLGTDCLTFLPAKAAELELATGVFQKLDLAADTFTRSLGIKHLAKRRLSAFAERFIEVARETTLNAPSLNVDD